MQNLKDIPCLILGIGNILWADEGFGVRVVEAFNDKYAFTDPNNVIADGGTLGMYLYDRICRAEKLLIFDCCDFKGKPGELRVLRNDDVKLWTSTKISPHQTGMNDLLVAAAVRGAVPKEIAVSSRFCWMTTAVLFLLKPKQILMKLSVTDTKSFAAGTSDFGPALRTKLPLPSWMRLV